MTNETSKLIKSNVKEINQTREMKSKKIMTRIRLDQEGHHKKSTSIKFKCFEEDWIWIGKENMRERREPEYSDTIKAH